MGRKLAFNRELALDKATKLFWQTGYSETSLKLLLKEMNMGESSFYHTFKSKKKLYLECLEYYNAELMTNRFTVLNSDLPALQKLTSFFEVIADDLQRYQIAGCLSSNSLSSDTMQIKEIKDYMNKGLSNFSEALKHIVQTGVDNDEFSPTMPSDMVAKLILTYLHGLFRLSAVEFDKQQLILESKQFIKAALNLAN